MEKKTKSRRHWLMLVGCCGMSGASLGININSIGVFFSPVSEDLGIYRGDFAMHSTIAALAMAIMYLIIPRLLEKFRFRPMLIIGVIAASLSTMAMALTTSLGMFYLLGAIRGLGSGLFALVPITILLNNWFEEKNGLALSVAFGFAGVAGAFMSPLFTMFISSFGWETTFIFTGILMAILCIPGIFFSSTIDPREEGLQPYGSKLKEEHSNSGEKKDQTKLENNHVSYFGIAFISLFVVSLFHSSLVGMVQHLPGIAESLELSANTGALMLSASMIGNVLFKLMIGFMSDYIGAVKSVVIMLIINFIAVIILLFFTTTGPMTIASFLFGSVYTVPPIGLPLLTNEFFGRVRSMRVYPILSFVSGSSTAFAMSLVGYIYDFTGSYNPALYLAIMFHIINISLLYIGFKAISKEEHIRSLSIKPTKFK